MAELLNANAGWLSVLALVLSIPLAILGNILTPKFQAWWALRTNNSRRRRITTLEMRISDTDKMMREQTYAMATFLRRATIGFLGVGTLWVTSIGALLLLPPSERPLQFSNFEPTKLLVEFIIALVVVYFFYQPIFDLLAMTRRVVRYEKWKQESQDEIEKLKRQLPLEDS